MSIIIVALPKMEDAKRIRKILMSHGFEHVVSCTTASAALIEANQHQRGLFISSCRLPDMHYTQLLECMPRYFEMLLIGSPNVVSAAGGGIIAGVIPKDRRVGTNPWLFVFYPYNHCVKVANSAKIETAVCKRRSFIQKRRQNAEISIER